MTQDPHPWAHALDTLYQHLWSRLIRGVHDRHAPARHLTLATVGADHMPQARTLVLRDANKAAATLTAYTDIQSAKVAELNANPRACLHVWDSTAHLQLRLESRVTLHTGDAVTDQWAKVPETSRRAYSSDVVPGQPISDALDYTKRPDPAAFAVLRFEVTAIDALHLGAVHRRARFERATQWKGQWLAP